MELIEAKWADEAVSSALYFHADRLKPKSTKQIVGTFNKSMLRNGVLVTSPLEELAVPLASF
ncbi:MAG: hypothetical protein ACKVPX_10920 [Myxococcaceae bacterium]